VKRRKQQSEQPTTQFLREHVQRLFANLPGAQAGKEEPIHQIRVARAACAWLCLWPRKDRRAPRAALDSSACVR